MVNTDAEKLTQIWNTILLSKNIEICSDQLKGLSITEVKLMKLVYFSPDYKIKDYLNILAIPNSTFTNMINRLIKKNLLQRKLDVTDLRSFCLELTNNGMVGIKDHLAKETELFSSILQKLDSNERATFLELLGKIIS